MAASWDEIPLLSIRRAAWPALAAGALALAGCADPAPPERAWVTPVDAARIVAQVHGALQAGEPDRAFALVDFAEKSRRMLGEIYEEGEPAEQDRLRGLLEAQLLKGWEDHWRDQEAAGEAWYASMDWLRPGEARVYLSRPDDPDAGRETVELTYSVVAGPEGPRIADRTTSLGGRGSTTRLFIELVKRKATPPDGGMPDLGRVNDAIEELIDEIRIQRIVLGPEDARHRRRPADADAGAAPE